jgi:hypothetical protein
MGFADLYFSKQKGFRPFFSGYPSEKLRYVVVIPAYCEPDLLHALDSLLKCEHPEGHVEVIVVMNMPENADQNIVDITRTTAAATSEWIHEHSTPAFSFLLIEELKMPVKDAGVGLARKTGMDQALYRFNCINNAGGCILSFDADSQCDPNYFTSIEETLMKHPQTRGFNLYFEHPLSGPEPEAIYRGIAGYELHLRYLNLFIRFTGFPHAFHTVGSCFGVRALDYAREGGMNKKKAGEDFYFLHKIIPLGEFREINSTCVMPSPRVSDRVPFGTGAAMRKYLTSEKQDILTYAPASFLALRSFFMFSGSLYNMNQDDTDSLIDTMPEPLGTFLHDIHAIDSIREIKANAGSLKTFTNRFFRWFDAFRIIKYLNYASRHGCNQVPVGLAVKAYLQEAGWTVPPESTKDVDLLYRLREIERSRA